MFLVLTHFFKSKAKQRLWQAMPWSIIMTKFSITIYDYSSVYDYFICNNDYMLLALEQL